MKDQGVWSAVLEQLKRASSDQEVERWFGSVKFLGLESNRARLGVPNQFCKDWIEDKFGTQLRESIRSNFGSEVDLDLEVHEEGPVESPIPETPAPEPVSWEQRSVQSNLNPRYTFETFVVGPCNQFAHAACKAVAESENVIYNPLFIYGGVGLGKTHLLNAIGNRLLEANPKLRVISIQAESFLNDLVSAIPTTSHISEFRKRFRKNCDVLLMDDIEILCGKQRTQEEFFYTFNELYESGRQIVMTSDRVPSELPELTERLRSRFESGMIADIQAPEYETKIAIIKKKAAESNLSIPDEVCDYLSKNIRSNIRKLEGSMIRICAYASLTGESITIELAKKLLANILIDVDQGLNPDKIIKAVAANFGIRIQELKSEKRMRKFVVPRQISMYLCRKLLNQSYPEIGQTFSSNERAKDHSTVIHSCNKITGLIDKDPDLRKKIEMIYTSLGVKEELD